MKCEDCHLKAFKRVEPLNFKEDIETLRIRLDVLFIKHFGTILIKRTKKDPFGIDDLIPRLSGQSQLECRHLQSQSMDSRQGGHHMSQQQGIAALMGVDLSGIAGVGRGVGF